MPIFPYYSPYRSLNNSPYFHSNNAPNYGYNYGKNFSPNFTPPSPEQKEYDAPDNQQRSFKKANNSNENVWLDLFGLKLYFDDVLILSLLFFLYKENVKDEGLFLALVLLLIS